MSDSPYFVYLMANKYNNVLYCGQTHNLLQRTWQHKEGLADGFTKRYQVDKLVYFETADDQQSALYREKQIKGYSRQKKISLIESKNPAWQDLYNRLVSE